jgi:hypothetical protein
MKFNILIKSFLFLAIGVLTFTSCEDDGTGTGTNGPSITFSTGSGDDLNIKPAELFTVRVNASKGESPLNTIEVKEDGTKIDASRLQINSTAAASNPILLFGDDKTSFTYDVTILSHSDVSTKTYSIQVMSEDNKTASVSLNVATDAAPPILSYLGSAVLDISPSSLFSVNLIGAVGSGLISTIAIYQDDVLMTDVSGFCFDGVVVDGNPYTLPAAYNNGFDAKYKFRTPATSGVYVYKIEIADEFGNTSSQSFTVNVGEPLEATLIGVLLNKSGPAGNGGLDLDNGTSVGSADGHIKDEGNVNSTSQEWKKQISGANGSIMKYVVSGQNGVSEDFTFESVSFKNEIVTLYDSGVDFTATNSGGEKVSNVVNVGDFFAVLFGDQYYLLEVTAIEETANNNLDSYTFNIKK